MTDPTMAIPWYKSPVYIGAVVTVVSSIAGLFPKASQALGLTDPNTISNTVGAVFQVIALVSGVFTAQQRAASVIQPITLTQSSADNHSVGTKKGETP